MDARVEAVRYMITDYEYDEPMTIYHLKDYANQLKEAKLMLKGINRYKELKWTCNVYWDTIKKYQKRRKPRA